MFLRPTNTADRFLRLLLANYCQLNPATRAQEKKKQKLKTKTIISLQHPVLRRYSTTVPLLGMGSLHRNRNENDADTTE